MEMHIWESITCTSLQLSYALKMYRMLTVKTIPFRRLMNKNISKELPWLDCNNLRCAIRTIIVKKAVTATSDKIRYV